MMKTYFKGKNNVKKKRKIRLLRECNLQTVKLNYEEKAKSINAIAILPNKDIHI